MGTQLSCPNCGHGLVVTVQLPPDPGGLLAGFMAERCLLSPSFRTPNDELLAAFNQYLAERGEPAVSGKRFAMDLQCYPELSVTKIRGRRFRRGIGLKVS